VEADCVQNEDQNFMFKILELATERVVHERRQIVYRIRIRTLCSKILELATEKLYMGRGRLCGKRVMGGDWRQQQRLGDDHQRSCTQWVPTCRARQMMSISGRY
jgi:hypothetical protein